MVQFKSLKLTGFKSFVDSTDLLVEDGLTGVVGPNGCGKSNLVEALRWVMGETSAKQMRGSDMSDVIFGGTSSRPARNVAEVSVTLDNSERKAPAMFNDFDMLEVTRRIERGGGSNYRVNGKDVRARDVQLLFADAATGARSNAMVSQGKIGALIGAKPIQRRLILEEAAGITGLHSRRHEAELRLKNAEQNMERLEDVLLQLDGQIASLQKQARQAERYRKLSESVRETEALLFHIRWSEAQKRQEDARELLVAGESAVRDLTSSVTEATTVQAHVAASLPDLRKKEAEAAAALQRLLIEREGLDKDKAQIETQMGQLRARIQQIDADLAREAELASDAQGALEKLKNEREELREAQGGEDDALDEAREMASEKALRVEELEADVDQMTNKVAEEEARLKSVQQRLSELNARRARLTERHDEAVAKLDDIRIEADFSEALEEASMHLEECEELVEQRKMAVEEAEMRLAEMRDREDGLKTAESDARDALRDAESRKARLTAEIDALESLLRGGDDDKYPGVIENITVQSGFELAMAAALGEDLDAPDATDAAMHWAAIDPATDDPALPDGVSALAKYVEAPALLNRRLWQIGIVEDEATGNFLAKNLKVGQRLVSRDGALWRWDGYRILAGAELPAAVRLRQRNRLDELRGELEEADAVVEAASERAEIASENVERIDEEIEAARTAEQEAHRAVRDAETAASSAREEIANIKRDASAIESRLQNAEEAEKRAKQDLDELIAEQEELAALPEESSEGLMEIKAELIEKRANLADARADHMEARSQLERMQSTMSGRRKRLEFVENEIATWNERASGAGERVAELRERQEEARMEIEELELKPEEIEERRAILSDRIELSDQTRKDAADELQRAENAQREADINLREAEQKLAEAREGRVRCEALLEQAEQHRRDLIERIRERVNATPDQLVELGKIDLTKDLPSEGDIEARLQRQTRERENLGAVNLRAEVELAEMQEQKDTMVSERDDLIAAIEKLRNGINQLNREARARLKAAFDEVDKHFQQLFVRLFGGGGAHLMLTDADDPLEAGLEIMASPPGKKLQHLSLLSGGEQALTAVALLFAVFLTNPAPICVLDEVDAPLDDANVDRFCKLLEAIGRHANTRFLVITHHRMTMARMNRLFGVTMAERGVSSLVSVDLHQAEVYSKKEQTELDFTS
ncbi:MAG: chromosome segregation protein SMC [Thalassospira sp.]|uniref:chromosome segregation protein SMC n=1 Tax=Thalassospira sp. TaxID=1912094 RepID=UPI001AFD0985|nr:chromosome segregation protein SMC [Thalassospira sp.]MBO6579689.1 chromosome segregation protein SMC [Thalassospira sp.]MBO6802155.1 chromosome segregation protein SMC [Thalassospira sp.]MBO6818477.1 chromosome segregation protein SMC [Thalassospira sp.]MBO6889763.1 chromosome segregation protein SMC [Thalassospira sp.]